MKKIYPKPNNIPVTGRLRICLEFLKKENLKNKILVDVGCSNGWLASRLVDFKLNKIIGIDPSQDAINFAKKNSPKAMYFISHASKIPAKNNYADFLTLFDVIEHVPKDTELEALREANRVLKKRGKLFLSTPNDNILTNILDPVWYFGHRHYKPKTIRSLIQKAGFKIEKLEIKGNIWFSFYLLWIYILKRLTKNPLPRNKFLEEKDDKSFNKKGIHTIYVVAQKK